MALPLQLDTSARKAMQVVLPLTLLEHHFAHFSLSTIGRENPFTSIPITTPIVIAVDCRMLRPSVPSFGRGLSQRWVTPGVSLLYKRKRKALPLFLRVIKESKQGVGHRRGDPRIEVSVRGLGEAQSSWASYNVPVGGLLTLSQHLWFWGSSIVHEVWGFINGRLFVFSNQGNKLHSNVSPTCPHTLQFQLLRGNDWVQ